MGPNGDTTILFEVGATLKSVSRAPGGAFGAPETLTTTMSAGIRKGLAVDGAGISYATWTDTSPSAVKAAVRPPGGPWGAAVTLESANSPDESNVAVTPAGDAAFVWRSNGGSGGLRMARRPAGGSFGAPFALFASGTVAEQPRLDINAMGDVAVGFRRRIGGGAFFALAAFQPVGSSAPSAAVFDPGALGGVDDDAVPVPGVDNAGNAAVLFGRNGTIKVSNKPPASNTWTSVAGTNGNVDTGTAANPRMVWNDAGQQAATWQKGSGATLQAATRSDLGTFSAATAIGAAAAGVNYSPGELAIDSNGIALAAFLRNTTVTSARTSGASWVAQAPDIATGNNPNSVVLSGDAQGNDAAAFVQTNASATNSIMAAGFDGAGPRLNDVNFPATAQTGAQVVYSVSPLDVWSNIASTAWSFGEGSTANGASGMFAYSNPGAFSATVTSTDSRSNSSSAVRNITVSGSPAPPAGPSPPPGPGPDTVAPDILAARVTNSTFAVDPGGAAETPVAARVKKGTTFVYRLSEAARVVFKVEQKLPGRRVGGRCRKPTRANRRRPVCTRLVASGAFAQSARAGQSTKRYSGRIGRRALKLGKYQATLTARDSAGNLSRPRRLGFRVVRR